MALLYCFPIFAQTPKKTPIRPYSIGGPAGDTLSITVPTAGDSLEVAASSICDSCAIKVLCVSDSSKPVGSYQNPAVVDLDFRRKLFTSIPRGLKRGDFYRISIRCFNPSLYKISTGVSDTSSSKALPPPGFGSLGLTELTTLAASVSALGSILGPAASTTKASEMRDIALFYKYRISLEETAWSKAKASNPKKQYAIDTTKAGQIINTYISTLSEHASELSAIKDTLQTIVLTADNYNLESKLQEGAGGRPTAESLRDLNRRLQSARNRILTLSTETKQAAANFTTLSTPYQKVIANNASLKARSERASTAAQELDKGIEAAKSSVSAENTRTLLDGLVNVINSSQQYYLSLPIQLTKDQSHLKISLIPRDDKLLLQPYSTKLLFPLNTDQFWGVSTGFYGSWLRNDAYSTRTLLDSPQDTTAEYQIVQERPGRAEFGVSAMLRYGRQLTSSVAIHGGFGPALSISDKVRPRLMVGGGLAFGNRHKFLLDGGLIGGYVDRKSQVFTTDRVLAKPDKITVSRLDVQGYFGLHYLFLQY
ncbi:hypothetical protein KBK19_16875 [Microvirga sp. STR05]|uniref:DUF3575 domain-containing protein n=1 Tax=Hymenobacter duratus TaxID=2771356 RepID=A0ABR8JIN7_9BACT|nr:hypothetical protein [Hymenobacter duratus]MBD2716721.1 hypothetical protein [Hymenobacter duratus]MBR7951636.1 hypothetical protein [Microvirga sp. STR05]